MAEPNRESPKGKTVSLFVTCIVDMMYPQMGMSVVTILERLGVKVIFPMAQTCCGQPAFNGGNRREAARVAKQFLRAFDGAEVIITPSGSCAAMVRHEFPTLFAGDSFWGPRAERAASITWEFSEYLVDGLGVTDLGGRLDTPRKVGLHDACHGLRLLKLGRQARALIGGIENAEVSEVPDCDVCCGFGGLFAVKMPDVSGSMLQDKVNSITGSEADVVVTGDASCLTQINGGLARSESAVRCVHLADLLAESLEGQEAPK